MEPVEPEKPGEMAMFFKTNRIKEKPDKVVMLIFIVVTALFVCSLIFRI